MLNNKLNQGQKMAMWSVFSPMLQRCDTLTDDELKTLYELGNDLGVDVDAEIKRLNSNRDGNPFAIMFQPVSKLQNKINEVL